MNKSSETHMSIDREKLSGMSASLKYQFLNTTTANEIIVDPKFEYSSKPSQNDQRDRRG